MNTEERLVRRPASSPGPPGPAAETAAATNPPAASHARTRSPARSFLTALTVLWSIASLLLVAGESGGIVPWRVVSACVWGLICWGVVHFLEPPLGWFIPVAISLALVWALYQLPPKADRNWASDHARAPSATLEGDLLVVTNFRSFRYSDEGDPVQRWTTQSFDLTQLEGCDFIVVPFAASRRLAHTMVSFRFSGGPHLAISIEARREKDEAYSVLRGLLHQFEIVYVMGDEEDLLGVRHERLRDTLYLHPVEVEVAACRAFLTDLVDAANKVHESPRWYGTLRSNCCTNLVDSLRRIRQEPVPWDPRMLMPGGSAELVYDLGLLDSKEPFETLRERARVPPDRGVRDPSVPFSTWIRAAP